MEGQLVQSVASAHRMDARCLAADPAGRFVATGGNDNLVKLWGRGPLPPVPAAAAAAALLAGAKGVGTPTCQAFIGHPSAVQGKLSSLPTAGSLAC